MAGHWNNRTAAPTQAATARNDTNPAAGPKVKLLEVPSSDMAAIPAAMIRANRESRPEEEVQSHGDNQADPGSCEGEQPERNW